MTQENLSPESHPPDWFEGLVSPRSSQSLHLSGASLTTRKTGEQFEVVKDIARLLIPEFKDKCLENEISAMDKVPVSGVSYFKQGFLISISEELYSLVKNVDDSDFNMIEIGGGEGQFARHFLKFDRSRVFVADISEKFLKLAPGEIRKICCDVRYPYFEKNKLDLAVFWVSFHHLAELDQKKALEIAVASLKPKGLLVFFEPNSFFFPRHIILNTFLKKHVYFDDQEKPIDYLKIRNRMKIFGMQEMGTRFIQPPYSCKFLKELKFWIFYYLIVKFLYHMDRHLLLPATKFLLGKTENKIEKIRRYSASYFFSVFQKTES